MMPSYDVVPLVVSQRDTYTYRSKDLLAKGQIVSVPFGSRTLLGVVWGAGTSQRGLREVGEIHPVTLGAIQLELTAWLASEYVAPLARCLPLMISPAVVRQVESGLPSHPQPKSRSKPRPAEVWIRPDRLEAYTACFEADRAAGRSSLLIVPEITMMSRLLERLTAMGVEACYYHSRLTPKQRAVIWRAVASGRPVIVVGGRSALWLPWRSLGSLIIDEEDDPGYKEERTPRYHARAVGAKLASLSSAKLISGSVSPSLETYRSVAEGRSQATGETAVASPVVVSPPEREDGPLGYGAWKHLRDCLGRGDSALLYAPARYHRDLGKALGDEFPNAQPHSFTPESDPAGGARALKAFQNGTSRVLFGGQSLARPWGQRATLALALGFDATLAAADFRAAEKVHGLLRRLAVLATEPLVAQTALADHPAVTSVGTPFERYARRELTERAALHLPPYARLTRILFELAGSGRAERAAKAAGQRLTAAGIDDFSISPCPIPERDGRERWQVLIKGDPKRLAKIVERTWSVDVDPIELM